MNLKGNGSTQGIGFSSVMAVLVAALLILAAKTVYDYRNVPVTSALADATAAAYFAERSGPFCTFEGVWHDWERDEWITLGCLEVKGDIREGSFSSAMGPRATSNFSMSGTYDVDSDDCIHFSGKDGGGKDRRFTALISVDNKEYPTQMYAIDEKGDQEFFIWTRKD
jgi:hypothetical protein